MSAFSERLRRWVPTTDGPTLNLQAADEIERLEAALKHATTPPETT